MLTKGAASTASGVEKLPVSDHLAVWADLAGLTRPLLQVGVAAGVGLDEVAGLVVAVLLAGLFMK